MDEIIVANSPPRRRPGRPCRNPPPITDFLEQFATEIDSPQTFLSDKERVGLDLAIKLRKEGVISTPDEPFEQSTEQEIDSLIGRGVFEFTLFDETKHHGERIFRSRIVNEVKGKTTTPSRSLDS